MVKLSVSSIFCTSGTTHSILQSLVVVVVVVVAGLVVVVVEAVDVVRGVNGLLAKHHQGLVQRRVRNQVQQLLLLKNVEINAVKDQMIP